MESNNTASTLFSIASELPKGAAQVSFSQFSLYKQCPHRWYNRYVLKNKEADYGIALLFGTAMHETIQSYISTMYEHSIKEADKLGLSDMLYSRLVENFKKNTIGNKITKSQLMEHYRDGVEILDFVKKKRGDYFSLRDHNLLGIEMPLRIPTINPNVWFVGYIDLGIVDNTDSSYYLYDFKTSTKGWTDKDKKDETKKAQLVLYREFFSKQYNIDIDKIFTQFLILKRKIWENAPFAQKRVQVFNPPIGPKITKKIVTEFNEFITTVFDESGKYKTDLKLPAIAGYDNGANCKWCPFSKREDLCPKENRLFY